MGSQSSTAKDGFAAKLKSGQEVVFHGWVGNRGLGAAQITYRNSSTVNFEDGPDKDARGIKMTAAGNFPSAQQAAKDISELLKNPDLMAEVQRRWPGSLQAFQKTASEFADRAGKHVGLSSSAPQAPRVRQLYQPH